MKLRDVNLFVVCVAAGDESLVSRRFCVAPSAMADFCRTGEHRASLATVSVEAASPRPRNVEGNVSPIRRICN
jgi:hypothetical protein